MVWLAEQASVFIPFEGFSWNGSSYKELEDIKEAFSKGSLDIPRYDNFKSGADVDVELAKCIQSALEENNFDPQEIDRLFDCRSGVSGTGAAPSYRVLMNAELFSVRPLALSNAGGLEFLYALKLAEAGVVEGGKKALILSTHSFSGRSFSGEREAVSCIVLDDKPTDGSKKIMGLDIRRTSKPQLDERAIECLLSAEGKSNFDQHCITLFIMPKLSAKLRAFISQRYPNAQMIELGTEENPNYGCASFGVTYANLKQKLDKYDGGIGYFGVGMFGNIGSLFLM